MTKRYSSQSDLLLSAAATLPKALTPRWMYEWKPNNYCHFHNVAIM